MDTHTIENVAAELQQRIDEYRKELSELQDARTDLDSRIATKLALCEIYTASLNAAQASLRHASEGKSDPTSRSAMGWGRRSADPGGILDWT